jgi:hypothetical protein
MDQPISSGEIVSSRGSFDWRRAALWILYALVLIACVVRAWEAYAHNPMNHLFSDPQRHWDHARDPLSTAPMIFFDPPLFQMWISLVQKWSLQIPTLIALYAGALSILTPWLWYRFMREALRSRLLAVAGWAAFAWLPSWLGIFSYFMTETLFLPLMGASLWLTLRAARKRTVNSFSIMVLLWCLTALTRGIALPLAGLAGLWVWWSHPFKLRTLAISTLIGLVTMVPFGYRNYVLVSNASPLGNGWLNDIYASSGKQNIKLHLTGEGGLWYYEFGSPSLYAPQFEPLTHWSPLREGSAYVHVDMRNGTKDWRDAAQANAQHGLEKLRLRLENAALVMAGQSWPDSNVDYFVGRVSLAVRWIWLPLLIAVVGIGLWQWRLTRERPLLPILIVCWFAFQAVSLVAVNEGRYRKPLEGLLLAQVLVLIDQARRRQHLLVPA